MPWWASKSQLLLLDGYSLPYHRKSNYCSCHCWEIPLAVATVKIALVGCIWRRTCDSTHLEDGDTSIDKCSLPGKASPFTSLSESTLPTFCRVQMAGRTQEHLSLHESFMYLHRCMRIVIQKYHKFEFNVVRAWQLVCLLCKPKIKGIFSVSACFYFRKECVRILYDIRMKITVLFAYQWWILQARLGEVARNFTEMVQGYENVLAAWHRFFEWLRVDYLKSAHLWPAT